MLAVFCNIELKCIHTEIVVENRFVNTKYIFSIKYLILNI